MSTHVRSSIFVLRHAALFTVEEGTVLTFDTDRGIHVQGNVYINMYNRVTFDLGYFSDHTFYTPPL